MQKHNQHVFVGSRSPLPVKSAVHEQPDGVDRPPVVAGPVQLLAFLGVLWVTGLAVYTMTVKWWAIAYFLAGVFWFVFFFGLAWIVWKISRRNTAASSTVFFLLMALMIAGGTVSQLRGIGPGRGRMHIAWHEPGNLQRGAPQHVNGKPAKYLLDRESDRRVVDSIIEEALADADNRLGLAEKNAARAAQEMVGKLNALGFAHSRATAEARQHVTLDMSGMRDIEHVRSMRALCEKSLASNRALLDAMEALPGELEKRLGREVGRPLALKEIAREFRGTVVHVMIVYECDARVYEAMRDVLGLVETAWGAWSLDSATGELLFTSQELMTQYTLLRGRVATAQGLHEKAMEILDSRMAELEGPTGNGQDAAGRREG